MHFYGKLKFLRQKIVKNHDKKVGKLRWLLKN
jgi:hypothetical protein